MLRNSKGNIKLKREVGKKTNKLYLVNLHIPFFSKASSLQIRHYVEEHSVEQH